MALKAYAIIMHINLSTVLFYSYTFYNYCYHTQIDTGINSSVMRNVVCAVKFDVFLTVHHSIDFFKLPT